MAGGPLEGVRIVDLTSVVVGPLATQIMADHGADVIKVEAPSGDIVRSLAGKGRNPNMSGKFLHLNRNKRSIALDLKKPAAYDALLKILTSGETTPNESYAVAVALALISRQRPSRTWIERH